MDKAVYHRAIAAGFDIVAAQVVKGKSKHWAYVVKVADVEEHLATHRCEPIGDTYVKILMDLRSDPNLFLSEEMLQRINKVIEK